MILSAFFYSLQYLDVKSSGKHFGAFTIAFYRSLVGFFIALGICLLYIKPVIGYQTQKLSLRGLLGGLTVIFAFYSVLNLSLPVSTVITSTSPVWTALLSFVLGRKNWNIADTVSLILCFSGIISITFTHFKDPSKNFILGVLSGFISAFLQGTVNIIIKDIKDESTYVITMYSMFGCLVLSLPGLIMENNTPKMAGVPSLCSTGVISFLAQMLKTKAIQLSNSLGVIILRYCDVIFSIVWDHVIYKNTLSTLETVGIILIIVGCLLSVVGGSYPFRCCWRILP